MSSRIAIVTGANKGIGLAIVRGLCKQFDGIVYLTARNEENGRKVVTELEAEGLKPKFHHLDIDSPTSIEVLRKYIADTHGGLDVLVNNAAVAYKKASTAPFKEQAEVTVHINFTGTLNLTRSLIPLMRPHGRIVNVSSFAGTLRIVSKELQKKFSDPALTEGQLVQLMEQFVNDVAAGDHKEKGWANTAYGTTKLALTALTKVHAREMSSCGKEDILVNAVCPGWVNTDMTSHSGPRTPDQGAETPVYLALLPPGSPTGELWRDKEVASWKGITL